MKIFTKIKRPTISVDSRVFSRSWHKHPFAIPVFTMTGLLFISLFGFLLFGGQTISPDDKKVVQLSIDGKRQTIPTRAESVGDLLQRLDIHLDEHDVVEPAKDTPITSENFSINVYHSRPVTVVDENGKTVVARVAERRPADIAKKVGLTIYPEDIVEAASPDETLKDGIVGDKIVVDRALPIKLSLYGAMYDIRTQADTVADLARERGIHYDNASVLPTPETKLKPYDVVFITEPGKQITTVEEAIPPNIQYVDSTDLMIGQTQVREEGTPGKRVVVYEIAKDGSKKPLQEIVVLQPVRKLVARGVKNDPSKTFSGDFGAALSRLRSCEGGYTSVNPAGYYGAYQFNLGTWKGAAPEAYKSVRPDQAPPVVQDQAARTLYERRGWQPWPSCRIKMGLQDVYR